MDRRERKKQETRQRLLQSAWELFQDRGYDHTTVAEITEGADVAKGTFFNYFATKEAIVDQIALWRIELLGNQVLAVDNVPQRAVARIKLLLQAMSTEFAPEQGLIRHMYLIRLGHTGRRESAHRIGSLLHELVVQGQASGEIRNDIESGFAVHLLMSSFFHYVARWWHKDHDHVEDVAAADLARVVDILMSGLQGEGRMP
jgi:AcrR family transcriptional regulator